MRNNNPKKRRAARTEAASRKGGVSKPARRGPAGSAQDNEDILTTSESDRLIVATAAGCNTMSQPFSEEDVERVRHWARRVRYGRVFIDLMLKGVAFPAGFKANDEVSFSIMDPTDDEAKAYRDKLKRLQAGWEWTPPLEFSPTGDCDLEILLAKAERDSIRLAVETSRNYDACADLDEDKVLRWAAKVRNEEVLCAAFSSARCCPSTQRRPSTSRSVLSKTCRRRIRGSTASSFAGSLRWPRFEPAGPGPMGGVGARRPPPRPGRRKWTTLTTSFRKRNANASKVSNSR